MTFEVECETDLPEGLDIDSIFSKVALAVLDDEGCPYEAAVSLLITDDEGIREINSQQRGIDSSTDVLSFPMNEFERPGDFSMPEESLCFDPESGELLLGDIVISMDRAISQAESFGHTIYREISFLIAHSMLHLTGYDHMTMAEEEVMFGKQDMILSSLGITREQI